MPGGARILDLQLPHGMPIVWAELDPDAQQRALTFHVGVTDAPAPPGWDGGYYAFMRRVLASERGGELYRQCQPMIEPVFGQTRFNRGMSRFHRRGRAAVRTEWRLITATIDDLARRIETAIRPSAGTRNATD